MRPARRGYFADRRSTAILQRHPHHSKQSCNLARLCNRIFREEPETIAAVPPTLGRPADQRATMHPAALPTFLCWRAARAPGPRPRPASAAIRQRQRLPRVPLHGVDFRFHRSPLPRVGSRPAPVADKGCDVAAFIDDLRTMCVTPAHRGRGEGLRARCPDDVARGAKWRARRAASRSRTPSDGVSPSARSPRPCCTDWLPCLPVSP